MSSKSKIEWTDATWSPVVGCTKCSPGCLNCYAERMAYRLWCMGNGAYGSVMDIETNGWNGKVFCRKDRLDIPLHWRKPHRIFVCSMSDLFHPKVPFEFIDKVFESIHSAQQHTYLVLTKRVKQMAEYFSAIQDGWIDFGENRDSPPPFIHLGVSISNQAEADEKIPILLQIPAAVRWLSIEPMLEEIDLPEMLPGHYWYDWEKGCLINGIIVGGESGPGARPMHPDWVHSIRDQCVAAGVAFFFKQWGEWLTESQMTKEQYFVNRLTWWPNRVTDIDDVRFFRFGKKKAGCLLDGKKYQEYPERS